MQKNLPSAYIYLPYKKIFNLTDLLLFKYLFKSFLSDIFYIPAKIGLEKNQIKNKILFISHSLRNINVDVYNYVWNYKLDIILIGFNQRIFPIDLVIFILDNLQQKVWNRYFIFFRLSK